MSDDKTQAAEERQAQALADALAGRAADADLPADALETAALIEASADAELSPQRQQAVFDRIRAGLPAPPRQAFGWWRALAPVAGLAAVALLLVFGLPVQRAPAEPTRLPRPPAVLLTHQARAANGEADLAPLRADMRAYRQDLFASLDARYAGRP